MRKLFRKFTSRKGESFIEILISILIVALGCLLIASMYTAAMNLNINASKQDDDYYNALSEMEQLRSNETAPQSDNAVIHDAGGNQTVEIETFGNASNAAYKMKE